MTGASQITTIILFDMTFIGLLVLFGVAFSTNFAQAINNDITTIFGEWPRFNPPSSGTTNSAAFPGCMLYIPSCFGSVADPISFVGYTVGFLGIILTSFLTRIDAIGALFVNLFSLPFDFGVPFINFILVGFNVIALLYAIGLFRGVSSGV